MNDALADYPYVLVRLACRFCQRRGSYRLARLAAKFGPEIDMRDMLARLAGDCAYWSDFPHRSSKRAGCGAYFPDLDWPRRPPDLPPGELRLRIVAGRDFKEPA